MIVVERIGFAKRSSESGNNQIFPLEITKNKIEGIH